MTLKEQILARRETYINISIANTVQAIKKDLLENSDLFIDADIVFGYADKWNLYHQGGGENDPKILCTGYSLIKKQLKDEGIDLTVTDSEQGLCIALIKD